MKRFFLTMGALVALVASSLAVSSPVANAQGTCNGSNYTPCYSPIGGVCYSNLGYYGTNGGIGVAFAGNLNIVGGLLMPQTTYCSGPTPTEYGSGIAQIVIGVGYCTHVKQMKRVLNSPYPGATVSDTDWHGPSSGYRWLNLPLGYNYWLTSRLC